MPENMTRRDFLKLGLGAAAFGMLGGLRALAAPGDPAERPNILFIMSDQHRWDFMHCMGHPLARTPVLDRLAAEGTLFDTAYCSYPVCVPARMSLITGRYQHSHGALNNSYALPEDQRTIGHYFGDLGYQTGAIGKMHFVDEDQHHGFGYRVEKVDYGTESGQAYQNRDIRSRDGKEWGISAQTEEETYEHYLADRTIAWLEQNGDKPFCLWLSFIAPHPPFIAPENLYNLYAGKIKLPPQPPTPNPYLAAQQKSWSELSEQDALAVMTAYLGRITLVDMNVGRVLVALERLGLTDKTVVSYTADHGDMQYQHKLFGKMVVFDGATRIPLILRYPGRVPRGVVRHEVVEHVDMYPTFCGLAGVPVPKTVQGRSLVPLLQGKTAGWPNTAFIEMADCVIVRTPQHKGVFQAGQARELYDLKQDPQEWNNLRGKPEGEKPLAEMGKLIEEWLTRTQPDLRGKVQPYRVKKAKKGQKPR